jgi:hypothetical protein
MSDAECHRMELVGLIEIAQRAGVRRTQVSVWRTRHDDFPAPLADLAVGPVFAWEQVKRWLEQTGRRTDAAWTREEIRPRQPLPERLRPDQFRRPDRTTSSDQ